MSKWIWTVITRSIELFIWENNIWNLSYGELAFKDVDLTLPLISFGSYRSKDKSHTSDSYCIIRNLWGKLRQTVWIVKPCTKANMRNFLLPQYIFRISNFFRFTFLLCLKLVTQNTISQITGYMEVNFSLKLFSFK